MEPIDAPIKLNFSHGNNFPANFVMISYVLLAIAVFLTVVQSFLIGGILLLLSLLAITNRHHVKINIEQNFIHDYSQYLGFIKIGKKFPLDRYVYVTAMPLIESKHIYGRSSNSIIISESYTTVAFFGERLRGKRIITKFDSKNEAEALAAALGNRLNLKYFEYDPLLVRELLRGERTI
jgi:hypothetical protein